MKFKTISKDSIDLIKNLFQDLDPKKQLNVYLGGSFALKYVYEVNLYEGPKDLDVIVYKPYEEQLHLIKTLSSLFNQEELKEKHVGDYSQRCFSILYFGYKVDIVIDESSVLRKVEDQINWRDLKVIPFNVILMAKKTYNREKDRKMLTHIVNSYSPKAKKEETTPIDVVWENLSKEDELYFDFTKINKTTPSKFRGNKVKIIFKEIDSLYKDKLFYHEEENSGFVYLNLKEFKEGFVSTILRKPSKKPKPKPKKPSFPKDRVEKEEKKIEVNGMMLSEETYNYAKAKALTIFNSLKVGDRFELDCGCGKSLFSVHVVNKNKDGDTLLITFEEIGVEIPPKFENSKIGYRKIYENLISITYDKFHNYIDITKL